MNRIAFEEMDKKKKKLYECMWGSEEFDFDVDKTPYKGEPSKNSYTFAASGDVCDRLIKAFGITNPDLFREKLKQSCSGSGRELKRIATLHSSALCALLFFYNVSPDNPYTMEIDGEEYTFTKSYFEYQNTVIEGRNPSNIDVVLVGTKSEEAVVLFLESKFSEYYEGGGRQLKIASAYLDDKYGKDLYKNDAWLEKMGFSREEIDGDTFRLRSKDCCYPAGIKQMISHYIGIRNHYDMRYKKDDSVAGATAGGAKILLGEILFTNGIGELPIRKGETCLASYEKKYRILARELNAQLAHSDTNGRISVLENLLTYDDLKDSIREEKIKRFYFELGKRQNESIR